MIFTNDDLMSFFIVFGLFTIVIALILYSFTSENYNFLENYRIVKFLPSQITYITMIFVLSMTSIFFVSLYLNHKQALTEDVRIHNSMLRLVPYISQHVDKMGVTAVDVDNPDPYKIAELQKYFKEIIFVNQEIKSIYVVKYHHGKLVFIVDADVDQDRNGVLSDDELGQPTGSNFEPPIAPEIEEAFISGKFTWEEKPSMDAYNLYTKGYFFPLYRTDGSVEAVVGVDFNGYLWDQVDDFNIANTIIFIVMLWLLLSLAYFLIHTFNKNVKNYIDYKLYEEFQKIKQEKIKQLTKN